MPLVAKPAATLPTLTLTPNPHVLQLYWLYLTLAYTLKNGLGGERPS